MMTNLDEGLDPLVEELPLAHDHLLLVLRVPELGLQQPDLAFQHPSVILMRIQDIVGCYWIIGLLDY